MKKILFIEDEPSLQRVMKEKLMGHGIDYKEAKNGVEGLQLALQDHPDLILLDIILPRMDGITLLKKLRQDTWGKSASLIVLTNLTDHDIEGQIKQLGVKEILIKSDWPIEALVKKILETI